MIVALSNIQLQQFEEGKGILICTKIVNDSSKHMFLNPITGREMNSKMYQNSEMDVLQWSHIISYGRRELNSKSSIPP